MPPYARDPVSEWFDGVSADWLDRAYNRPNRWEGLYLAPPTRERRRQAAQLGVTDLDARDRWGENRWTRALKRSAFWVHRNYGYAGELRPGDQRAAPAAATSLRWETGGLVRKPGWPTRRRELRIMIVTDPGAALEAVRRRPGRRRWDLDGDWRSKPGPPDRPWEG